MQVLFQAHVKQLLYETSNWQWSDKIVLLHSATAHALPFGAHLVCSQENILVAHWPVQAASHHSKKTMVTTVTTLSKGTVPDRV